MNYELITEDQYNNLPDDDEQCFVQYEAIVRASMNRFVHEDSSGNLDQLIQSQYMISVSSVGKECGIRNTDLPEYSNSTFYNAFKIFSLAVQGEVARIRVRGRGVRHPFSVSLAENTRPKIEHHIGLLRAVIQDASLPDIRKRVLLAKLDELKSELSNRRVSFAKSMAILVAVSSGLGAMANTTTIAAEGKAAVHNIMSLLGVDKASEENAALRLSPPAKLLPAPDQNQADAKRMSPAWKQIISSNVDDEIPF